MTTDDRNIEIVRLANEDNHNSDNTNLNNNNTTTLQMNGENNSNVENENITFNVIDLNNNNNSNNVAKAIRDFFPAASRVEDDAGSGLPAISDYVHHILSGDNDDETRSDTAYLQ